MAAPRTEFAPAKINLTLRVLRRRPDGYHELESLIVFAALGDTVSFAPGKELRLTVRGPTAPAAGNPDDNLVLKAARQLAQRVPHLKTGHFVLTKRLPVAAGIGGGSSDAAAALRLLARANRLAPDDKRLHAAATSTGADVPVCLDPRPQLARGIGEILSAPLKLPRMPAVLINPGVPLPTKDVFAALVLSSHPAPPTRDIATAFVDVPNDLEPPAIKLRPVIADVLADVGKQPGCVLARMSGSGATCFGLFASQRAAASAARALRARHSAWWVRATLLNP